jgi:uncharacterized protein (TIGR02594 family)
MKPIILGGVLFSFFCFVINDAKAKPFENDYIQNEVVEKVKVKKVISQPKVTKKYKKVKSQPKVKSKVQVVQGGGDLISKAASFLGSTARQLGLPPTLWCADFMNMLLGGSDRRAISYTKRGTPASYGCVGCVAITKRKGGGHVGVVKGYDSKGNPILISGNYSRRVGVGSFSKKAVIAYRNIT